MKTIELTPEEIEMIETKRSKEEAEKIRIKNELDAYVENKKAEIQNKFALIQKRYSDCNEVIEEAFSHCPKNEWNLLKRDITISDSIYQKCGVGILEKMEYTQTIYELESSDKIFKITASHHTVWENKTSYFAKQIDKGVKLFVFCLRGNAGDLNFKYKQKPYSDIKTILKKIEEIREKQREVEKEKIKQASAVDNAVKTLQNMYPDAIVEKTREWIHNKFNPSEGKTADLINITLLNQTKVSFIVYPDGILSRKSLILPKEKTQFDLLTALNNL